MFKKGLIIALMTLAVSGCSSLGKGMVEGFIETQDKKKDEVSCTIMSSGFPGLNRAKEDTIKVLTVHGIGPHAPGHSMAFMLDLTQKMGLDTLERQYKQIGLRNFKDEDVGTLRIYRFENKQTGKVVLFYEQTWSNITEPIKADLAYDTTRAYANSRASINAQLKKYMNQTLPDSSIYFGPAGEKLLDSSIQSFCWMMNFSYNELPQNTSATCRVTPKQAIKSLSKENFVFITNSLGSRITIDALQMMAEEMRQLPKDDPSVEKAIALLSDKEITLFMLANQLPLLQMGRTIPKHAGQCKEYCNPHGKYYSKRLFKQLNVVAISDPNDLLSYGLEPASADKYLDSALCPLVSNVSITTTPAMDLGVGSLANPLSAHTNYQRDPYIADLIVEGLTAGYVSPKIQDKCRWVHLQNQVQKEK